MLSRLSFFKASANVGRALEPTDPVLSGSQIPETGGLLTALPTYLLRYESSCAQIFNLESAISRRVRVFLRPVRTLSLQRAYCILFAVAPTV